jgi:bifunctional non-homologous end joining protein LigD
MGLREYNAKRDFKKTAEPAGKKKTTGRNIYVIQKHDASHLHYDFRLELDGSLKSWAVPKGPSLNPADKRLAMQVEDHPIDYAKFEGIIPEGEYGGGEVVVWDFGRWTPIGDAKEGYRKGRLEFELEGKKLHGRWVLVRTRGFSERAQWLLIKRSDEAAAAASDTPITEARPESVLSKKVLSRDLEATGLPESRSIAKRAKTWSSNRGSKTSVMRKSSILSKLAPRKKPAAKAKGRVLKTGDRKKKALSGARTGLSATRTGRKGRKAIKPAFAFVEPQLATLVDAPPVGDRWIHEIKYDGYRTLCQIRNSEEKPPVYWTRKGLDWSDRYQSLSGEVSRLPVETAIIDG